MKNYFESIGTVFAMLGFLMLSTGEILTGFILGLISCCFLIPVFFNVKLYKMLGLQLFFAGANLIGIINNF